jgi:hypothetical protein
LSGGKTPPIQVPKARKQSSCHQAPQGRFIGQLYHLPEQRRIQNKESQSDWQSELAPIFSLETSRHSKMNPNHSPQRRISTAFLYPLLLVLSLFWV